VLIAHADAAVAAALLERVRADGYEGRAAADLATLRTLLRRRRPNAVLLGSEFPDGDGWAALELLRTAPETRRVPVSMIALRGDRHTRLEMAGGAQALDAPAAADRMDALREAMGDAPDARRVGAEIRPGASGTEDAFVAHGGGLEDTLRQAACFLHGAVGAPLPPRRKFQSRRRRGALDLVGKKVLVVDGDIRDVYAVTGALERQGMLVLHAESGEQGLAALEDNPDTDAVLVDAGQPGSDALGAIRFMRGGSRDGSVPIIALTGGAAPSSREDCLAAGASDCIAKPIDEEHLVALLRAWLLTRR
jgi:CheY-like chemotaxis protein